jgi:4'-phosphopantetheinyl transferase
VPGSVVSKSGGTPAIESALALARDEVHLWRVELDATSLHSAEDMRLILSADERARADGLCFERDRRNFILVRGVLRTLLGRYLGLDPGRLCFRYGLQEKPALDLGSEGLHFNVSHSGNLALLAFARGREVGVDVERMRHDLDIEGISARCFTPPEAAALRSLPRPERTRAFFACWTRREAFAKATGAGLSLPADRFRVLAAGMPAAGLLDVWESPSRANRWTLRELDPGPGYLGALAVERRDWCLACWQWPRR